jgi:pSer/pThr/pTyr-binding forkhead associated (FHA) protein
MNRVLLSVAAAASGAFVVWLIAEPIPWLTTDLPPGAPVNYTSQMVLGALVGAGIGVGLGAAEGIYRGSRQQLRLWSVLGGFVGVIGGLVGIYIGQMVFGPTYAFGEKLSSFSAVAGFAVQTAARAVGWALMGMIIGAAQGLVYGASDKLRSGLIGGLAGGAVGGFLFQVLWLILRVPEFSRAVGFVTVGGAVGLGISTAEEVLKQAWIRVLVGRNEGREYILSKPITVIGRDELADVGLFGDRSVGMKHAVIRRTERGYLLQDAGNTTGTRVNGVSVSERLLRDGDVIEIGSFRLEFHQKAGRVPVPQPVDVPQSRPEPVAAPGVCPYCGGAKDPVTGACLCTVSPAPGASTAGPSVAPGRTAVQYVLVGIAGPHAGARFELTKTPMSIGREQGRDIVLADQTVSRRHAVIQRIGDSLLIVDEGSSNGTFVNGVRVTSQQLKPGDEVRLGSSAFRLEVL